MRFNIYSNKSVRKPNKIWVQKDNECYNKSIKSWLQNNGIKIYSAHNEGKSLGHEQFIRILRNKIYKYMTSL